MMVAGNPYQGERKRVLCVCSGGVLRSPTIAWVLSNEPFGFNTRSAGTESVYALIPVDEVLLHWADEIVCAEQDHANKLPQTSKPVHVLNIPDKFAFRDGILVMLVTEKLKEIFGEKIG
jgi:predicted protein tyrosine phosphatase